MTITAIAPNRCWQIVALFIINFYTYFMNEIYREIFSTLCHIIGCYIIWYFAQRDNSKDYTLQRWFIDLLLIILTMVLIRL
jgi:hypothetical protein